jgi:hypothetical protein
MTPFVIIVFGWPSAVFGAAVLLGGVVSRKRWLTALGALAASGFCLFVASYPPPARWLGLVAFAANWLAVLAVSRQAVTWAGAALVPHVVTMLLVGYVVLVQ